MPSTLFMSGKSKAKISAVIDGVKDWENSTARVSNWKKAMEILSVAAISSCNVVNLHIRSTPFRTIMYRKISPPVSPVNLSFNMSLGFPEHVMGGTLTNRLGRCWIQHLRLKNQMAKENLLD